MKRTLRWLVILGVIVGGGWLVSGSMGQYWRERSRVIYREEGVSRGRIVAVVNATGTVKPVQSVPVGSFVSGPVLKVHVEHNAEVKKDDPLAEIDPKIHKAKVARELANVAGAVATQAVRDAEVDQVTKRLEQAIRDEKRGEMLEKENKNFISKADMEKLTLDRLVLKAQLAVAIASRDQAKALVDQARAGLMQAEDDLAYTKINSPVDGVILQRKIDEGQTVAATFQTPELFVVAPNLRKEVHIFASVDEADIGLVREAKRTGQPVNFTVAAYPDDLFQGKIYQIRMNATTTQNVVTYPVVIAAPNDDLKLTPEMTASVSFQLQAKEAILRVPNAALRFYPQKEQVRPEDRAILESRAVKDSDVEEGAANVPSAEEKAETRRKRNQRHVWVREGELLRAVAIETGISSNQYTEVVAGELREGQQLVIGVEKRK